jgi:trans-aconitate methyltransferase
MVVGAHEFDAAAYRKASGLQKTWGSPLIDELNLRGHERVLDLGCGDGTLTQQIAQRVPDGQVVGIDASYQMIELARGLEAPNLRFEWMDINELDMPEPFDVVFSNAALHWVHDHEGLHRRIYRCLKPAGIARLNFAGEGNCMTFLAVLREVMSVERFRPAFEGFTWPWFMPSIEGYADLTSTTAFSARRVWGEVTDKLFATVEQMIGWLDQPCLVPFLPQLPEGDRAAFRLAVIDRMIERAIRTDGQCFECFRRINVWLRK